MYSENAVKNPLTGSEHGTVESGNGTASPDSAAFVSISLPWRQDRRAPELVLPKFHSRIRLAASHYARNFGGIGMNWKEIKNLMQVYNFDKRIATFLFQTRVLVSRSSKVFGNFCPWTSLSKDADLTSPWWAKTFGRLQNIMRSSQSCSTNK